MSVAHQHEDDSEPDERTQVLHPTMQRAVEDAQHRLKAYTEQVIVSE